MADNGYPMTREAYEELSAELKHKLEVERPRLAARLKAAIELGDLSENADYAAAKEAQGFLEGRIQELQAMLRDAVIIDEAAAASSHTVRLGSRVTIVEEGEDEPEVYQIVGQIEANPVNGKISDESPLGRALLGRKVGDTIRVQAPVGELIFEIKDIG
jgi:transcription elongation factor GreA